jgi:endonuclease IV
MNKIIKIIILTLLGAGCFSAGLYYATLEFKNELNVWDSNYQIITDKVYAFEKVSDPKIIRKHINELNKILDDIDFLHILIESGQLADESLIKMMQDSQEDAGGKIDSLYSELLLLISNLREYNITQDVVDESNLSSIKLLLSENVDKQKQYIEDLNTQLTGLHIKLNEVNKVIDKIKNSKLSKYLK